MQPDTPLLDSLIALSSFQMVNTQLPENEQRLKRIFRPLMKIPKMSTFAIGAIINKGVSLLKQNEAFVNIGVWNGFTFLSGVMGHPDITCIGVDNYSQTYAVDRGDTHLNMLNQFKRFKSSNHFFYRQDYKDYFQKVHKEPIGFYLFDGPHDYDNQLEGIKIAEPFFTDDCIILIDDTNFPEPHQATLDFMEQSSHSYKLLLDIKTSANCHPTFWNGVMVIQRNTRTT